MKKIYFITLLFISLVSNAQVATTTPTGSSTEVGVTEGELSVSLNGSAGYNIPIAVPPGINGVEPRIGLSYNSNSGNGIAGYGWNISGLSAITRIPSTKHHDNAIDPVDGDQLDRLALDGKRLVIRSDSPSQIYGGTSTATYETEGFSNIRVFRSQLIQGGQPAYYRVEYPDGSVAIYGDRTNDAWLLTYWENAQGLRISYTYNTSIATSTDGIYYMDEKTINSIKYGTAGSTTPINEILFVYKPRQRVDTRFSIANMAYKNVKILDKIVVKGYGGSNYRSYKLAHDAVSGYERLISVTESVIDNGVEKKYNPTIFTYPALIHDDAMTLLNVGLPYDDTQGEIITGDFDGNGELDFMKESYPYNNNNIPFKQYLNANGDSSVIGNQLIIDPGFHIDLSESHHFFTSKILELEGNDFKLMNKDSWCIQTDVSDNDGGHIKKFNFFSNNGSANGMYQYSKEVYFPNGLYYLYKSFQGDFNGDGLTDSIQFPMWFPLSNGETYPDNVNPKVTYVNLDRRINTDFIKTLDYVMPKLDFNKFQIITSDVNNDGKTDLVVFRGAPINKISVYSLNADDSNLQLLFEKDFVFQSANIKDVQILKGDFNGDTREDFFIPKDFFPQYFQAKILINVGNTFIVENVPYNDGYAPDQIVPVDFNGDGKTDIINFIHNGNYAPLHLRCYTRNDNGTWSLKQAATYSTNMYNGYFNTVIPLYIKKSKLFTGMTEFNFLSNGFLNFFFIQNDIKDQFRLNEITIGNGVKENISYETLVSNNTYSSSYQFLSFPNINSPYNENIKVVSKIEKQTEFSYTKQLFKYHNAVSNTEGLGFIGFKSIMKTNWHNDDYPIQSTISNYDILKRGALVEEYQVLGLQSPSTNYTTTDYIEKKTYAYDATLLPNKVFKIKNTSSLYHNALIDTSVEKTNTYNDYNILTQSITSTKNALVVEKTDVIDIVPENITSGIYVIGRPISKTQTSTIFPLNQASETTTAQELYAYNGVNLLSQLQKKGHNTVFVTEDYQYDTWGNKKQKTISATGLASRTEKFDYDDLTHRFLTKSYDVNNLTTEYTYDNVTGLLTSIKNPLLQTATYSYDKWGKKIQEIDFLGVSNSILYSNSDYGGGAYFAQTYGDSGDKVIRYDRLGRVIAEMDLFNYNSIYYEYDIYDRKIKTSHPFNAIAVTTIPWNEIKYDEYGRPYEAIDYKGNIISTSYFGLTTLTEDGPKTTETLRNSLGETISLTDNGGTIEYQYFANGNIKKSIYNGIETVFEQDGWGRKTKMFEPSAGRYIYTYNHYGELLTESSLKGTTTYNYDDFGNLTFKTVVGKTSAESTNIQSDYTYDATKRVTNIAVTNSIDGNSNYLYEYDTVTKQLNKVTETLPQATFIKQYGFDNKGRLQTEKSRIEAHSKASENVVYYTYENNKLWKINKTNASGELLYHIIEKNENEQILNASYGNGITIANTFDAFGYPLQYKHDKGTTNIMTLTNTFDTVKSNLLTRSNSIGTFNWAEDFTNSYDDLDRLKTYKNANSILETQTYEPDGRIESNALGTYNYTGTSNTPYKNTSVTLSDEAKAYYGTRGALTIPYNAFMNPIKIAETGKEVLYFGYNAEGDRSVMYYGNTSGNKLTSPFRKYYSADGTMEVKYTLATTSVPEKVEFFTYIGGDAYSAPIVSKQDDSAASNYFYLHRDYLGSILAITNNVGAVVEKRQFDAWGGIVDVQDGSGVALTKLTFFDRGYTGHEHLQGVALIHMNGRLYDPKLHRFLQPDNYVQDPYNSQHFNRYSYGLNNPLRYTDPSGESLLDFLGFLFYSYVSTAQATGEANPTKWNSDTWINIGLGGGSMLVSAGLTNGTNNYIDNYNNAGQPGETFSDGFIDTVNPVNMVKGIWQSGVDTFNAQSNIITGNGSIEDYTSVAEGFMPAFQMAKGLATLGYKASQGNEYAQGSLVAQVVVILVARKVGSAIGKNSTFAPKGGYGPLMDAGDAARYAKFWQRYAPKQIAPGEIRLKWFRTSGRTGRLEESSVLYDRYGRQIFRVDYSDHMRPLQHSSPHLHQYDYGPMSSFGRESVFNFN